MNKPRQLRAFVALAWYAFRAQTRNPATFFFGFIFPVVFISIFGLISGGNQKISIGIPSNSLMSNPVTAGLESQSSYVTLDKDTTNNLEKKLKQGKIAGILEVTNDPTTDSKAYYNVDLTTSSANAIQTAQAQGLLRGVVDQTNLKLSGITNPPLVLRQHETAGRETRYIDFALPGQIGFSLLSTAIFGTVFGLIYLKKALILKRMFATPTKALTILLAQGTSRLIVALAQTILILLLGVILFKFYLPHGWITFLELIVLSTFGLIAFLGFGYLIAGLSNDENSASPLTNLVTLPQFLLSGTFFSTENLPAWLQPIANNLPLSYFNIAVRKITTEGGTLVETWPYVVGLAVWGAIMYILAARTFKWQ
ncbi:MAG: ABC transporter permease [Candidatus Levybacteria bacterium]|nr:ABC transporter permease [Candidatus Levybacteria bacterium]